jgi:hypothetical protein
MHLKNRWNIGKRSLQYLCTTIATYATSIWSACNIPMKYLKYLKHMSATCVFHPFFWTTQSRAENSRFRPAGDRGWWHGSSQLACAWPGPGQWRPSLFWPPGHTRWVEMEEVLLQKWFVANPSLFLRVALYWATPTNGSQTTRPYKSFCRGGWCYQPPYKSDL